MRPDVYTIFARWDYNDGGPADVEELDVKAESEREAIAIATKELNEGYQPGWKIARVVKRIPGTLFF